MCIVKCDNIIQRNGEAMERIIAVGLNLNTDADFEHSMDELEELARAANMEVLGSTTQNMPQINKAFYIGSGKVEQVRRLAEELEADGVVFDNALSPIQLRNLQQAIGKRVMDRTMLILEIFSKRARTREAKLQVEVALLQYMLPRLVGMHEELSRQGGGSGALSNRGAGEKKLELDRRHIEKRLTGLRRELVQVEKDRETQRKQRQRNAIPLVSLVGYTNAGKSTVMNALVDYFFETCENSQEKKVLAQDMLFATLDTTVRKMESKGGKSFLLSDTVGFIDKLPHHLIKAFRSTLEEVKNADLIVEVIDYSDPYHREHMQITEQTLQELGAEKIPIIYAYNKMDLAQNEGEQLSYPLICDDKLYMAAGQGVGIDEMVSLIEKKLFGDRQEYELLIPYTDGNVLSRMQQETEIISLEYMENGIYVRAYMDEIAEGRYGQYRL